MSVCLCVCECMFVCLFSFIKLEKYDRITKIRQEHHWLPIKARIDVKILLLTWKAPIFLSDPLNKNERNLLVLPRNWPYYTFFLFWPNENEFWNTFSTWWNNLGDIQIPTQCECLEENILFGFQTEPDIFTVLNFCILIAKYHIYCQRIHNENGINFFNTL